ncbi:MAG TPA: AarF/ABC1/UbiB kinase family protein [Planctomycetota bacterium]
MGTLSKLAQLRTNTMRAQHVVRVLAKYGLADWLAGLRYDWLHSHLLATDGTQIRSASHEARIRLVLCELGTTFIKLGQTMSTRPDIVGAELAAELSSLQDNAPADAPEAVQATIQAEFGRPVHELFAEFDMVPMASASIGQVHRARLPSGAPVAVKVRHSGIEAQVRTDLDLLAGLAEIAEKHAPALRPYRPVRVAAEFRRSYLREMDFVRERENQERLRANFSGDATIHVPAVYPELSSRAVLTMELLEGVSVADASGLAALDVDLRTLAERGASFYLRMIFRDGFYHADPHPGNFLVLPGGTIGVLDCGMVGHVGEDLRTDLQAIVAAFADADARELTTALERLGTASGNDRRELLADVEQLLEDFGGRPLEQFDFRDAIGQALALVRNHRIELPAKVAMLIRTLTMLEGLGRHLHPGFRLAAQIHDFRGQLLRSRFGPSHVLRMLRRRRRDWSRLLAELPASAGMLLERIRLGRVDIRLEHTRLEEIVERLVRGILTAALFLGSAQLLAAATPPTLWGTSVAGAAGCMLAVVLGWRLLRAKPPPHLAEAPR